MTREGAVRHSFFSHLEMQVPKLANLGMANAQLIVSVLCCALLPSAAAVASGARPWEVGLRHSRLGHRFCGGSIVNDRFVVTAASCLAGDGGGGGATALGPEDLRVRPGDHIGLQRTAVPGLDPGRGRRRRQGRLTHGADYKVEVLILP